MPRDVNHSNVLNRLLGPTFKIQPLGWRPRKETISSTAKLPILAVNALHVEGRIESDSAGGAEVNTLKQRTLERKQRAGKINTMKVHTSNCKAVKVDLIDAC